MAKILTIVSTTYRSAQYMPLYFQGISEITGLESIKFILVMNEPDEDEKCQAYAFKNANPGLLDIMEVPFRESIAASVNRGLARVDTPYCSFLDADDIRIPDAFLRQVATLEAHPEADLTYGDFLIVDGQGKADGKYISVIEFDEREFRTRSLASPTHLFSYFNPEKIKGYDEQYYSAGDFDFNIRAAHNAKFIKTPGVLLRYTRYEDSGSASSPNNERTWKELVAIYLRYGLYSLIYKNRLWENVPEAEKYKSDDITVLGQVYPLGCQVADYPKLLKSRRMGKYELALKVKWRYSYLRYILKRIEQKLHASA